MKIAHYRKKASATCSAVITASQAISMPCRRGTVQIAAEADRIVMFGVPMQMQT